MNGQPENPRRAVLITGAASGIGAATARRFIQEGWLVAINYLDGTQRETARSLARTAAAPETRLSADARRSGSTMPSRSIQQPRPSASG